MKIRPDVVTNSSSSSFIIARKPKMNDKQKDAILRFVEKELLGKKILGPDSTEEEINKIFEEEWEFHGKDTQEKVRAALKAGKVVYSDWVSFEETEYYYADLFEEVWRIMEENGDGDFEGIETDLSY